MDRPLAAWHRGDAMQSNNVTLAVPLHHRSAWALSAGPMTKADRDAIGPDGTVRLRAYLTMANSLWLPAQPMPSRFGADGLIVAGLRSEATMSDPDDRENGFYWIRIGDQEAEVAQWQAEWVQWLVAGRSQPLSDLHSLMVIVLSERLLPPASSS